MSTSRNEQRRGDDFEAFVQRFLKALGYIQIEKHPKIGTKRADLLVTLEGSASVSGANGARLADHDRRLQGLSLLSGLRRGGLP